MVIFMNDVLKQYVQWVNEGLALRGESETKLKLTDGYSYVSILLFSHCTGFSFEKAISILSLLGSTVPLLERERFFSTKILAYSRIGRGNDGNFVWQSQRDQTR